MKFVEVKEIPDVNRKYHPLKSKWAEFMSMNVKVVKVDLNEGEYKSLKSACETMAKSVRMHGLPITVTKRGDEIYLIRRDM